MNKQACLRIKQVADRYIARFNDGRWAHHVRPSSVALLLTMHCNARCVHCDIWESSALDDSLSREQWLQLLTDLASWLGPVHVMLTGGEALLKPFIPELIAHGSSLGLQIELLTNGYRCESELLERIALARPWRVTLSVDGVGSAHDRIRGREDFWQRTGSSIDTLVRLRRERRLKFAILLKCVVMHHNLADIGNVARYARENGVEVHYQPIERNYGAPDDLLWFEHSPNWPDDVDRAVAAVEELISLKRDGYPIANSIEQLEVMIPYFRDPASLQRQVRAHIAHEKRPLCAAVSMLEIKPNGDIVICNKCAPIGNVTKGAISDLWKERPRWWQGASCPSSASCASSQKNT